MQLVKLKSVDISELVAENVVNLLNVNARFKNLLTRGIFMIIYRLCYLLLLLLSLLFMLLSLNLLLG